MDWWWAAVGAAVAWTVLVALWGILTRSVANILVGVGLVMGALLSSGDALQLYAQLPEATAVVLQSILFCSVLATGGFPVADIVLNNKLIRWKRQTVLDWINNGGK